MTVKRLTCPGGHVSTTGTTLEIRRFRSGMLRRFGVLYHLSGLSFLLRRLRMDERSVQHIRKANDAGPIVYVFYGRSQLDWLALNQILNRKRLPLAQCTVGLRSLWVRPLAAAFEQLWGSCKRWTKQISDRALRRPCTRMKHPPSFCSDLRVLRLFDRSSAQISEDSVGH